VVFGETADLTDANAGSLVGATTWTYSEVARISATAKIVGSAVATFSELADLTGIGALRSAETVTFSESANLTNLNAIPGSIYNAAAWFPTASTVTISLWDPISSAPIAVDSASAVEVAGAGLYVWHSDKLTVQPVGYKEYVWVMTDSITEKGGVIRVNAMGVNDLMSFVMENGETYAEQMRLIRANAAGRIIQAADGSYGIRDAADSKDRIAGDDAANGGRDISSTDGTV
jgi:hypothetical protein